jgi:hypothetical protein
MAKFYGLIGFDAETVETRPSVWEKQIIERNYYGDLVRNTRRLESSGNVNDNINISNQISIIADPYANQNFHKMLYVKFMGTKWKITNVEVQYPRLVLTIGGEFNG